MWQGASSAGKKKKKKKQAEYKLISEICYHFDSLIAFLSHFLSVYVCVCGVWSGPVKGLEPLVKFNCPVNVLRVQGLCGRGECMSEDGEMGMLSQSSHLPHYTGCSAVATFPIVCKAVVILPICHFMHLQKDGYLLNGQHEPPFFSLLHSCQVLKLLKGLGFHLSAYTMLNQLWHCIERAYLYISYRIYSKCSFYM